MLITVCVQRVPGIVIYSVENQIVLLVLFKLVQLFLQLVDSLNLNGILISLAYPAVNK